VGLVSPNLLTLKKILIMEWKRLNGEPIMDIYEEVESAILQSISNNNPLRICIGSDSQVKGEMMDMATAIVFIREGKGGFMFVNKSRSKNTMGMKERLLKEVADSIEIAYKICPLLERYEIPMEVHADISTDPSFKSNVALKEAMGYIMGMGYTFKAKPNAFAGTSCANKIVQ
jgi:predicted RNase H-related nuclease YkuK (DUF458 family)